MEACISDHIVGTRGRVWVVEADDTNESENGCSGSKQGFPVLNLDGMHQILICNEFKEFYIRVTWTPNPSDFTENGYPDSEFVNYVCLKIDGVAVSSKMMKRSISAGLEAYSAILRGPIYDGRAYNLKFAKPTVTQNEDSSDLNDNIVQQPPDHPEIPEFSVLSGVLGIIEIEFGRVSVLGMKEGARSSTGKLNESVCRKKSDKFWKGKSLGVQKGTLKGSVYSAILDVTRQECKYKERVTFYYGKREVLGVWTGGKVLTLLKHSGFDAAENDAQIGEEQRTNAQVAVIDVDDVNESEVEVVKVEVKSVQKEIEVVDLIEEEKETKKEIRAEKSEEMFDKKKRQIEVVDLDERNEESVEIVYEKIK